MPALASAQSRAAHRDGLTPHPGYGIVAPEAGCHAAIDKQRRTDARVAGSEATRTHSLAGDRNGGLVRDKRRPPHWDAARHPSEPVDPPPASNHKRGSLM